MPRNCRRRRQRHLPPLPPSDPMTIAAQGDLPLALQLGPVLGNLPADLFQQEVLWRLGPRALTFFGQASHGCAAAADATALMQWAKHAKSWTAPRNLGHFYLPPLCLQLCLFTHRP